MATHQQRCNDKLTQAQAAWTCTEASSSRRPMVYHADGEIENGQPQPEWQMVETCEYVRPSPLDGHIEDSHDVGHHPQLDPQSNLGLKPQPICCDVCGASGIDSVVHFDRGTGSWVGAAMAWFVPFGVVAVPYMLCSRRFKDVRHECPVCGNLVGKCKRMSF